MVAGMTEERYTLEEAAILLNRQACEREGHQIVKRPTPLTFVALRNWPEWRCNRCDVEVVLTYPQQFGPRPASPHGAVALTILDAEPDYANVAFTRGGQVLHFVRTDNPSSPAHHWVQKDNPGLWHAWNSVVEEAEGERIYAWNEGEWMRGEAAKLSTGGFALTDLTVEPETAWVGFRDGVKVQTFMRQDGPVQTLAHQWMWARNGRIDQTFTWRQVVAAAKGAPIYASTDAAWIEREAKP